MSLLLAHYPVSIGLGLFMGLIGPTVFLIGFGAAVHKIVDTAVAADT